MWFVDASHYIYSAFMGYIWSLVRILLPSSAGRKRYNILGALNTTEMKLETVRSEENVTSLTVIELMEKVVRGATKPVVLVLDNAGYQNKKCRAVQEKAESLGIRLLHLPPSSPNLNLMERLWKWVRQNNLSGRAFEVFEEMKEVLDNAMTKEFEEQKEKLATWFLPRFQLFDYSNDSTS